MSEKRMSFAERELWWAIRLGKAEHAAFRAGMNAKRGRTRGRVVWRILDLCSPEEVAAAWKSYQLSQADE